jgi:lipopolysaccharide/colanic/teichoic acid biosynthesis glycosyltransferase
MPPLKNRTKRCLDVLCAGILLLLCLPVMVALALLVRLTMGAPILYREIRPGLFGRQLQFIKFRSMRPRTGGDESDGSRLTAVGRFMRKTSLDELPQLWLVLTGKMSLVGPRPLLLEYLPYFTRSEMERFQVRPGITGWAQIHGRNYAPWDERLANDVWYVRNWSLRLDLEILLKTVGQVLAGRGVAVDSTAVMANLREERSAGLRMSYAAQGDTTTADISDGRLISQQ